MSWRLGEAKLNSSQAHKDNTDSSFNTRAEHRARRLVFASELKNSDKWTIMRRLQTNKGAPINTFILTMGQITVCNVLLFPKHL